MKNTTTMVLGVGALITALVLMNKKSTSGGSKKNKRGGFGGSSGAAMLAPSSLPATVNVTVNENDDDETLVMPEAPIADVEPEKATDDTPPPTDPVPPSDPAPVTPTAAKAFSGDAADIDDFEYMGFID